MMALSRGGKATFKERMEEKSAKESESIEWKEEN